MSHEILQRSPIIKGAEFHDGYSPILDMGKLPAIT